MCIAICIGAMWAQVDVSEKEPVSPRKVLSKGEVLTTIDGSEYVLVNDSYAELYSAKDVTGTFTIPASVKNGGKTYPVTGIRGYAFEKTNATTVNTGDVMEKLGGSAFSGSKLQVVNLGTSVSKIDLSAFGGKELTTVNVASGNMNYASQDGVLYNKAKTTLVAFPAVKTTGAVTVPSFVQTIGAKAFSCAKMSSVTLPSSVTTIRESAFEFCSELKTVNFGSNLKVIEASAFNQCNSLQTVSLPSSFETMGHSAFSGCVALQSINVPADNKWFASVDGVLYLKDKKIIRACPAGKKGKFVIPDGTEVVGFAAFSGCKLLNSVSIPNSVTKIDTAGFSSCWVETMTIPNSVTVIAQGAFMYSNSMCSIKLSDNLKEIGNSAFVGCFSLGSITIPDKVTSIGDYAFSGCSALRSVVLGVSLTDLNKTTVFARYPKLVSVYTRSKNPVAINSSYFENVTSKELYVPRGRKSACEGAGGWIWFRDIYEYDVEYKGDVNADSDVNVTDVTSLINHILGNASFEAKRCDVNEDSKVDVSDVTSLINLLLY